MDKKDRAEAKCELAEERLRFKAGVDPGAFSVFWQFLHATGDLFGSKKFLGYEQDGLVIIAIFLRNVLCMTCRIEFEKIVVQNLSLSRFLVEENAYRQYFIFLHNQVNQRLQRSEWAPPSRSPLSRSGDPIQTWLTSFFVVLTLAFDHQIDDKKIALTTIAPPVSLLVYWICHSPNPLFQEIRQLSQMRKIAQQLDLHVHSTWQISTLQDKINLTQKLQHWESTVCRIPHVDRLWQQRIYFADILREI